MAVNLAADVHRLGFAKYDASVVFFRCPHEPLCLPFGRFAKSEHFGIGLQPRQPLLATLLEFGFLRFETMARFGGVADAIDKRTADFRSRSPMVVASLSCRRMIRGRELGHDHASGSTRWALATR